MRRVHRHRTRLSAQIYHQPGLPPSTAVILHIGLKTGDQPIQPFSLFHQDIFTYNRP